MAKVVGVILTILSSVALLGQLFLYLNTNAHLPYNPAAKAEGLIDAGLAVPLAIALIAFIAGVTILSASTEPESI